MDDKVIHDDNYYNGSYKSAIEILSVLKQFISPKTIIDVGGGIEAWSNAASEIFKTKAILCIDEISRENVEGINFLKYNIEDPIIVEDRADLAICLEVAEHIKEEKADVLIKSLTDISDFVLFSAAIPGQGGNGHINEQIPRYWATKFYNYGYLPIDLIRKRIWDNKNVCWWYKQNTILYVKQDIVAFNDLLTKEFTDSIFERLLMVHPECAAQVESSYRFI